MTKYESVNKYNKKLMAVSDELWQYLPDMHETILGKHIDTAVTEVYNTRDTHKDIHDIFIEFLQAVLQQQTGDEPVRGVLVGTHPTEGLKATATAPAPRKRRKT